MRWNLHTCMVSEPLVTDHWTLPATPQGRKTPRGSIPITPKPRIKKKQCTTPPPPVPANVASVLGTTFLRTFTAFAVAFLWPYPSLKVWPHKKQTPPQQQYTKKLQPPQHVLCMLILRLVPGCSKRNPQMSLRRQCENHCQPTWPYWSAPNQAGSESQGHLQRPLCAQILGPPVRWIVPATTWDGFPSGSTSWIL